MPPDMAAPAMSWVECDLCGSSAARLVVNLPAPSLGTDGALHNLPLRKIQCLDCGLIRNDIVPSEHELQDHYGKGYGLGLQGAAADPVFFTDQGPLSAHAVLRDWIVRAVEGRGLGVPRSILEAGCGTGALMDYLQEQWPEAKIEGIDLDRGAVAAGRARDRNMRVATIDEVEGRFDAIISVAVMEHLPSPVKFLHAVRGRLNPQGWAAIVVPVQDWGNRDIFFWDHLFHFHSGHVSALVAKVGLSCVFQDARHPLHGGYGLTVITHGGVPQAAAGVPEPARNMRVDGFVQEWREVFERLNAWLAALGNRRSVIYGLGESFDFLWAYTTLRHHLPAAGLDDNIERASARHRGFPVLRPSREHIEAADALLLTFKPKAELRATLNQANKPVFVLE